MPRLYERVARKEIWRKGQRTKSNNKQGYSVDRSKPEIDPETGGIIDQLIVEKGQKYYTWHPKGSDWQYSLKKPDLRDAWTKELEEFKNKVTELNDTDEDDKEEGAVDELRSEIEERRDEMQNSLDSMPDQLQESSILNERISDLDNLLEELND